ncbi:MAG: NAD-dependent epimerase/dehydratase family protein [Verrucomicrobiota bacterium]|mgnify:CR=1 FL=1
MKILILGGHGFVGKRLAGILDSGRHEVVCRSRRDGCDLADFGATRRLLAEVRPETICNCAAHVGSLHYVSQNAAAVFHDNALMALNLYRAAVEACPQARIINPLSNCSYPGDADVHYEPDWWRGEVHDSVFSYGNTKRMIYVLARCYARQHGLRTLNFLVPNAFGPGDYTDPNRTHALNGMIIRMLLAHRQNQPEFEIWGTGQPLREWGYIDDIVAILKGALTLEADLTYPVNIAQNKGYTIRESAELIAQAIGYQGGLIFNAHYQDGAMRKILDDRKFRRLFPDFQFIDHQEAIRRTVDYYRSVL